MVGYSSGCSDLPRTFDEQQLIWLLSLQDLSIDGALRSDPERPSGESSLAQRSSASRNAASESCRLAFAMSGTQYQTPAPSMMKHSVPEAAVAPMLLIGLETFMVITRVPRARRSDHPVSMA